MIQASQFVPVTFDAAVGGFGLTKSVGRLAARLLATYGDLIDDEAGLHVPTRRAGVWEQLQLMFRDGGLLTVTPAWASFEGLWPSDPGPDQGQVSEAVQWAVELLASVLATQRQSPVRLSFETTWLLRDQTATQGLVEYLGLAHSLGGLFAGSEEFEIRGDTTTLLPDLFPVTCQLVAGRLGNYEGPENVGIRIKHHSPDNRLGGTRPIDYTRPVMDRFFAVSPRVMRDQLERYFPDGGVP